jgi:hypothetical protein
MGWTPLAALGRLAWPVLGSLLPGLSPRLMMGLAGVLVALVVVGGPAGTVWLHMHGVVRDARNTERNARDLYWIAKLNEENEIHEKRIAEARKDDEPDLPADRAERLRLCAASATCRSTKNRR